MEMFPQTLKIKANYENFVETSYLKKW